MRTTDAPIWLWDYCAKRSVQIHNVTPKEIVQLQGTNPTTATYGTQPDISNTCQYNWYDWCYFRKEAGVQFAFQKKLLGEF